MSHQKRIAIIGAGTAGLPAIKSCLEEGLVPVCYEMTNNVGGLWNYTEDDCPGRATVFRGVVTNSSKVLTCYSDFPQPDDFPAFLPHQLMVRYFELYAEKFHLTKHIHFENRVLNVKQADDHNKTGKWVVQVKDSKRNIDTEKTFDGVIVCAGHHAFPKLPTFEGQNSFKGEILHSHQYRKPEDFVNKRVVLVGIANSSADIAGECGSTAQKVYLSSSKKAWILPRTIFGGVPIDSALGSRKNVFMKRIFPVSVLSSKVENEVCNRTWNHELYGLKPSHRFLNQLPVVNDSLAHQVLFGKVELVNSISHFDETGVAFEGDHQTRQVDTVIFATGFRPYFPYLKDVIDVEEQISNIYELVFPLKLTKNSFAFVGLIVPDTGSCCCLYEAQARWVACVLAGKITLPSSEKMTIENRLRIKKTEEIYKTKPLSCPGYEYTDRLYEYIGVKPNILWMLLTDPVLFWACFNGPLLPAQFRLKGSHKWANAREYILTFDETKSVYPKKVVFNQRKSSKMIKLACSLAIVSAGAYAYALLLKKGEFKSLLGNYNFRIAF